MSSSVSQRFQRIPALQKEREAEYGKQAAEADRLLQRLRDTRIEAERAAKEEIEQTRRLQLEEFYRHPEYTGWLKELKDMESKAKEWSREGERRSQQLREIIAGLERQLNRKQEELERVRAEIGRRGDEEARLRKEITDLESEFGTLQASFNEAKREQESLDGRMAPAHEECRRLRTEIDKLKIEKDGVKGEWEKLRSRESMLVSTREGILREIEGLRGELANWEQRMAEIGEQINRAMGLFTEAQSMAQQRQKAVEQANREREGLGQQVEAFLRQKTESMELFDRIKGEAARRQEAVNAMEGSLEPLRVRYKEIMAEIARLSEESGRLKSQYDQTERDLMSERTELNRVINNMNPAEQQINQAIEAHRQAEQAFAASVSRAADAYNAAAEFEKKAMEAHAEVHQAKDLEKSAITLMDETKNKLTVCHQRLSSCDGEVGQLRNQYSGMVNPEVLEARIGEKTRELEQLESVYVRTTKDYRDAREKRESLENVCGRVGSRLRSLQSQLEQQAVKGPGSLADRIRADIAGLDRELEKHKSELGSIGGINPFEQQLMDLRARSSQLEGQIYSSWSAANAPPRLLDQLKREAEVVMRAEAAITLERQQETVLNDASRMTRYHISTKPRFDLDDEAKGTLLREHTENRPPREIATRVLEMCEQRHIHA